MLSVDDFQVTQPPALPAVGEPDLRLRTKYSMARFHKCTTTDSCPPTVPSFARETVDWTLKHSLPRRVLQLACCCSPRRASFG